MYGIIFDAVRDMVVQKHGELVWEKLANEAGLSPNVIVNQGYPDQLLYDLVGKAAELLKVPGATILELAGYWFIPYIKNTEYSFLLSMAGNTLPEILQNLNQLHAHLKISFFRGISPPMFRCESVTATSVRLHYVPGKASRTGLAPLIIGLLKGLVEVHFKWNVEKVKIVHEKSAEKGAANDVFYISWKKLGLHHVDSSAPVQEPVKLIGAKNLQFGLDFNNLNKVFPFNIIIDKSLNIVQLGSSLAKITSAKVDAPFFSSFEIIRPKVDKPSFKDIFKFSHSVESRLRFKFDERVHLEMSGQWILTTCGKVKGLCFIGSPVFESTKEVLYVGLSLSDFAIHDPSKERLFAIDAQTRMEDKLRKQEMNDNGSDSDESKSFEIQDDESSYTDQSDRRSSNSSKDLSPAAIITQKKHLSNGRSGSVPSPFGTSPSGPASPHSHSLPFVFPAASGASGASACPFSQSLASTKTKTLVELLIKDSKNSFDLTFSLLETFSADSSDYELVLDSLLGIYQSHGKLFDFLMECFRKELKAIDSPFEMFRVDSLATTILAHFFQKTCKSVIKPLIKSFLMDVLEKFETKEMQSASPSDAVYREKVFVAVTKFLDALNQSSSKWPKFTVKLLSTIHSEASLKDPSFAQVSLTSLVFLRLINPAIICPEKFQITTQPLQNFRTVLINISKLINNLSNGIQFDQSSFQPFNQFIKMENQQKVYNFFDSLVEMNAMITGYCDPELNVPPITISANILSSHVTRKISLIFEKSTSNAHLRTLLCDLATA